MKRKSAFPNNQFTNSNPIKTFISEKTLTSRKNQKEKKEGKEKKTQTVNSKERYSRVTLGLLLAGTDVCDAAAAVVAVVEEGVEAATAAAALSLAA